jgi:L-fuconolactonase
MEIRGDWLGLVQEEIVDPERPIVDPHHHFFINSDHGFEDYLLDHYWADTGAGHNIEQTVFVECGAMFRTDGPEEMKPVGQTEWVAGLAAQTEQAPAGKSRVRAIVGFADLTLGSKVRPVLEAQTKASALFKGIRQIVAWDESDTVPSMPDFSGQDTYRDPSFRAGFAELAEMGLMFDSWHYHPQTPFLVELARDFPETKIVLDHLGTPLNTGIYASQSEEIFEAWKQGLNDLAELPNTYVKLGGMLMPWNGFGWEERDRPGTSDELVELQGRYYHHAIEAFGPSRCMFESNFPADKPSISYHVVWNAFKKLAAGYSESEKDRLFRGTAMEVYGLDPID